MQNSDPLVILGLAVIALTAVAIVVPVIRRTGDLITAWNLVLFGGAIFIGVGCLEVKYGYFHWPDLQWFQPRPRDVQIFMLGTIAFYAAIFISYYKLSLPRKISARVLNKWPPFTAKLVFPLLALCIVLAIASPLLASIPVISAIFRNVSHKCLVFAVVISFCFWYRNKRQVVLLFVFLAVFLFSALDSMVVFNGRRLLLSVVSAPLICMYWMDWRYRSIRSNLFRVGIAAMIALTAAAFYSTFRHFNKKSTVSDERSMATTIGAMKTSSLASTIGIVTQDSLHYFAQYSAHYSLLVIQQVDTGQIERQPLNNLMFVLSYPVPRLFWEEKPRPLSGRIVKEILRMRAGTNWGLGIVGDAYQQGGIAVIMLYGFLLVVIVRVLDDSLTRQPDNVFLLGILCTSAPHFVAWIRGDCGVMTVEIGEAIVFAWVLGLIGRFVLGTAPVAPQLRSGPPMMPRQPGHFAHDG